MTAVTAMSANAQAVCFFIAMVLFIVLAVIAALEKAVTTALLGAGLAFVTLVWLWSALAAS